MDGRDDLPTPVPGHLSLDQLAELDADLLSPREDAAARAHLSACTSCTDELRALADVSALLAAAADVPMPADIALRMDAALADEVRQRASVSDGSFVAQTPSAPQSTGRPPAASRPPTASGSSAAVGDLDAVRARRERSTRLRRGAAALVGVAAVLGGGYLFGDTLLSAVDLSTSSDDSADSAEEGATAGDTGAAPTGGDAGNAYTSATLASGVARLLDQTYPEALPAPTSSLRELDSGGAGDAAHTGRCVAAVTARADQGATPLAVDVGTFDGAPAVVVVLQLPAASGAAAEVWAVGDACLLPDQTGLQVLDRVELQELPTAE